MSKIIYRKVLHLRVVTRGMMTKQLLGPLQASPSRGGISPLQASPSRGGVGMEGA